MYQLYMQILMLLNMVQPLCELCHSVRAVVQITLCLIGLFVAVCSRFLIAWGLGVNVILSLLSLNSGVCAPMKQAQEEHDSDMMWSVSLDFKFRLGPP